MQSVLVGQPGVLGVGVATVSTTGGCDVTPNTGIVTCNADPPVGVASCVAESVTAAVVVAVKEFPAVVT